MELFREVFFVVDLVGVLFLLYMSGNMLVRKNNEIAELKDDFSMAKMYLESMHSTIRGSTVDSEEAMNETINHNAIVFIKAAKELVDK